MPELVCNLAGTPLVVLSEASRLLDRLARALAPLRVSGLSSSGFRCELSSGIPDDAPAGARIHFEGTPPLADGPCVLGEAGDRRFLIFPGRISLVASLPKRRAIIVVRAGDERALTGILLMHLLDWVLEADAQTLVHGAAFADPAGKRGILIFAPSGAGKTTLALALLKSGFRLYSDDLAVLAREDGLSRLGGLARPMKVHRETARLMPWLEDYLGDGWDANGEQPVDPDTASKIGPLGESSVPLAAIVRLAGRGNGDHALQPASSAETLMQLCAENLRMGFVGVPDFERRTFRRLGEIVSHVPTYDFFVGAPLSSVAFAIARILSPA